MLQSSSDQKNIMEIEKDNTCVKLFYATNVYSKETSFTVSETQIPLCNAQCIKLSQISGVDVLSISSNETSKCKNMDEKGHKKVHSNVQNNSTITENNNIIPETPDLEFSFRNNSPYCSYNLCDFMDLQNFNGLTNIIQSMANKTIYSTQPEICDSLTASEVDLETNISSMDIKTDITKPLKDLHKLSAYYRNNKKVLSDSIFVKNNLVEFKILSPMHESCRFITDKNNFCKEESIQNSSLGYSVSTNFSLPKRTSKLGTESDDTLSGLNTIYVNEAGYADLNFNNPHFHDDKALNTNIGKNIVHETFLNNQYVTKEKFHSVNVLNYINYDLHKKIITKYVYNNPTPNGILNNKIINVSLRQPEFRPSHYFTTPNIVFSESQEIDFEESFSVNYEHEPLNNIGNENIKNNFVDCYSQSNQLSLPISQDNNELITLPSTIYLSNYCCEYDKAYTKQDLKPISHRNYYSNRIIPSLKEDFDKVIAAKQSLESYFNIPDDIFKEFKSNLHQTLDSIIYMLDNDLDWNC